MKRRESNIERELRTGRRLAHFLLWAQVLFSASMIGVYVWKAMEAGKLKEFLVSTLIGSASVSILIFTVVKLVSSMKRNHQSGIFTRFFDVCSIKLYSGMKKIFGSYTHKKLRIFLKDTLQKNFLSLGMENQTDIKLCKTMKPLYWYKKKHLIYRIAFYVPQDFHFNQSFTKKLRSCIITELRIHGIDGLFSSYYDIERKISLDSVQLLRVFYDRKHNIITLELLYIATKQDADYIIQLRDRELEDCNRE